MTVLDRLSLAGKTALITGGGSGLGQAMALSMADAGCDIAVAGRRREPLEETKGFVEEKGSRCFITQADVADSGQVDRMVGEVIAEYGRVDILVNNAGGPGTGRGKTLPELTDEDWHEGMDANIGSAFFCSRAIVPHFLEQGGGRIINVSSGMGMRAGRGSFMYSIAKGGVIQLTKVLAMTYARDNIRATCIAPGSIPHFVPPEAREQRAAMQPLGRPGVTYEIGPLAVFLASEASDYMSGETVLLDGGAIAGGVLPAGIAPVAEG